MMDMAVACEKVKERRSKVGMSIEGMVGVRKRRGG